MNYNGLWGVMIEAIKELTARVEELEKQMTTLIIVAIIIAATGWMIRYYDPHN